jgi:hypothetical protein
MMPFETYLHKDSCPDFVITDNFVKDIKDICSLYNYISKYASDLLGNESRQTFIKNINLGYVFGGGRNKVAADLAGTTTTKLINCRQFPLP